MTLPTPEQLADLKALMARSGAPHGISDADVKTCLKFIPSLIAAAEQALDSDATLRRFFDTFMPMKVETVQQCCDALAAKEEIDRLTEALGHWRHEVGKLQSQKGRAEARCAELEASWRCFHCGKVFSDRREAAAHFGTEPGDEASCLDPSYLSMPSHAAMRRRAEKAEAERDRFRALAVRLAKILLGNDVILTGDACDVLEDPDIAALLSDPAAESPTTSSQRGG